MATTFNSPATEAAATRAVAHVRELLDAALEARASPPASMDAWVALDKNLRELDSTIGLWEKNYISWARSGRRPDGTPYSWDRWFEFGQTLAESAGYYAGVGADVSLFKLLKDTTTTTVQQVIDPREWSTTMKALLAITVAAFVWPRRR
jgi:hypothetical protein